MSVKAVRFASQQRTHPSQSMVTVFCALYSYRIHANAVGLHPCRPKEVAIDSP